MFVNSQTYKIGLSYKAINSFYTQRKSGKLALLYNQPFDCTCFVRRFWISMIISRTCWLVNVFLLLLLLMLAIITYLTSLALRGAVKTRALLENRHFTFFSYAFLLLCKGRKEIYLFFLIPVSLLNPTYSSSICILYDLNID